MERGVSVRTGIVALDGRQAKIDLEKRMWSQDRNAVAVVNDIVGPFRRLESGDECLRPENLADTCWSSVVLSSSSKIGGY